MTTLDDLVEFLNLRLHKDAEWGYVLHRQGDDGTHTPDTPSRILDDISAKRAVIDECTIALTLAQAGASAGSMSRETASRILRVLAFPYRHEPEYQAAWAPDPDPSLDDDDG